MSSNTFISFDWRSAPNTNDTISAIIKLLTEADSSGLVNMRLSQSTAADVVSLQERDGTPMVRRREYIVRLACTDALQWLIKLQSRRKVDNQVAYWAKLWQQVRTLQSMMVNQQQVKMRAIQYKHADPTARSNSWALRQVKQRVEDLALSLGVHPAAFGVLQEDSGTVHIPERIKIEIVKITDIHLYNNRDRTKKWLDRSFAIRSVLQLGEPQIPQLVESLALRFERGHRVDAVVVLEHRNVTEILGEHQYGLKDVLIVMTAGFPSKSTREFLHMLSKAPKLSRVPFLYVSDHDMKGFTIFQVLKYGSKTCAWSSEIMVCPQLEYVGPTKAEMLVGPSQYRPHFERQRQADFPRETAKARKEVTDRWQHRLERRLAKQCKPWLKKDDAAVRGFASLGWLDYEPAINQQIKQMAVEDSKFRLADLCQADERYLRIFVEAKLRERCLLRRRVRPEPPAQRSQTALAFLHASSQTLDTSQTLLGDGLGAQLSDGLEADQLGDGLEALSPDAMKRLLEQTSCF